MRMTSPCCSNNNGAATNAHGAASGSSVHEALPTPVRVLVASPGQAMMNNNNNNNNTVIGRSPVMRSRRKTEKTVLPEDYEPSKYSVICGRGKGSYQSDGNVNFRALVKSNLDRYREAPGRLEKSFIVSEVLNMIRESCPTGAFVKCEKGRWYDLDDAVCREKVGSLFRDFLHTEYKSSSKAKHAKKLAEKQHTATNTPEKAIVGGARLLQQLAARKEQPMEEEERHTVVAATVVLKTDMPPPERRIDGPATTAPILNTRVATAAAAATVATSIVAAQPPGLTAIDVDSDDPLAAAQATFYDIDDGSLNKIG